MTAGRPPLVPQPEPETVFREAEIAQTFVVVREDSQSMALAASQHQAHVRAVAAQIGYQLPGDCADPDLIQRDIASNMRRTAEAMLQIGLGLICLKEACQHGEFTARLEVLRLEPRAAQRYMQVASRLSNASTSTHLLKAAASQSKLLELIVLDDEQIEELELTGQTGELKLDDVASMSVKELRAAVRNLRGEAAAAEQRAAVKSKLLLAAQEEAVGFKCLPHDEQVDALLAEATNLTNAALTAISGRLRQALVALENHGQSTSGVKDFRPLAAGLVGQIQKAVTILRDEFMLDDIIGDGVPEWMRATAHLVDE